MEQRFFHHGKTYSTFEEMMEADREYMNRNPTKEDFDYIFDWLRKDIELNYRMYEMKITNARLNSIIQGAFFDILTRLNEENENK